VCGPLGGSSSSMVVVVVSICDECKHRSEEVGRRSTRFIIGQSINQLKLRVDLVPFVVIILT
jgi:hypothetical protein